MKKITDLFKLIEEENIILEEVDFFPPCIDGIYFKVSDLNPTIGININLISDSKKYISVLAEELGHHFTSLGDLTQECVTYSQSLTRGRQEKKARIWAANYLISDDIILEAILHETTTLCGLASYFNVEEWLIEYKLLSIYHNTDKYNSIRNTIMSKEVVYESCSI